VTVTDSSALSLLAPPLQRWLWEQGWSGLRPAQAEAFAPILEGRQDVLIAAATASGKTEAAFLPLLTRLWNSDGQGVVLYVAPMKALINDQYERSNLLCERLGLPVYPWHGDIGEAPRRRFVAEPRGVVLITPESLESLFFRRGAELRHLFGLLEAVVVDELHGFIGCERGRQLQSLLHRLEAALGRRVQRIGLSATLGDMRMAADFLRLGEANDVRLIVSEAETKSLRLLVTAVTQAPDASNAADVAHTTIAASLFKRLRDANYLIFPNSTGMVELYADALRRHCEGAGLPVSFFPHHGRLGKTEREGTEFALKRGNLPVSVICTSTLEMGIDIGAIRGVVQIGAPETVASLCQRVGRAGRRGAEPADLWQYCVTGGPAAALRIVGGLHEDLVQAIAVIRLFLAKWYEPPAANSLHYSTLVQQILSLIGERCGVTAVEAYRVLCLNGPFREVSESDFIELLSSLAANELIMQDANRVLLHGLVGERRVNHFTFFAAFQDTREYRLRHAGKELGTLPLKRAHCVGDALIFAGRRWQIADIDHDKLRVDLTVASVGKLPKTNGVGIPVYDRVREEMRILLTETDTPEWLDGKARDVLAAARCHYSVLRLHERALLVEGRTVYLFSWRGDATQDALACLLRGVGLQAENIGMCLRVNGTTETHVGDALVDIATSPLPDPADLLKRQELGTPEKWDWALPDRLFFDSFASRRLDLRAAHELASRFWSSLSMCRR
jgi:ATP-dependent Lhr-like helicase